MQENYLFSIKSAMAVVQNIFPPMLTMSRVAMITTREPQEEIILSRLSAKKIQAGTFHSSATRLWNKTEPSLRDMLSQKRFLGTSKGNKVHCLRKKRPVTPSELCNNAKEKRNTNTRTLI